MRRLVKPGMIRASARSCREYLMHCLRKWKTANESGLEEEGGEEEQG